MTSRLAVFATACALLSAACGSAATASPSSTSLYDGARVVPSVNAPPLQLVNYDGTPVNLTQFRGKVVLVTFVYTHCPDVCPTIVSRLGATLNQLGSGAGDVQVIGVSTDATGDTPASVAGFLADRHVIGRMLYLLGTPADLKLVWTAWQVEAAPDAQNPKFINHT